jgi:hypothetical protein
MNNIALVSQPCFLHDSARSMIRRQRKRDNVSEVQTLESHTQACYRHLGCKPFAPEVSHHGVGHFDFTVAFHHDLAQTTAANKSVIAFGSEYPETIAMILPMGKVILQIASGLRGGTKTA